MKTHPLPLEGAFVIELDKKEDERGYFCRLFCAEEFGKLGIPGGIAQINRACSKDRHTIRGLHYQLKPNQEAKTILCTKGEIFDVMLDVRPNSKTFLQHCSVELSSGGNKLIHVPKGLAHGYQSLADDTEIIYIVDEPYCPGNERGIRWDDPRFQIEWPFAPAALSDRATAHPDFCVEHHLVHKEST